MWLRAENQRVVADVAAGSMPLLKLHPELSGIAWIWIFILHT